MKVYSIKWNPRTQAVSHLGKITGEKYIVQTAEVVDSFTYTCEGISQIAEITPTIYDIIYKKYGKIYKKLRVFNPIEVLFKEN